jgi:hypothetical protein
MSPASAKMLSPDVSAMEFAPYTETRSVPSPTMLIVVSIDA